MNLRWFKTSPADERNQEKNLNFFRASKFIGEKFDEDKDKLVTFYNDNGLRFYYPFRFSLSVSEDRVGLLIRIDEGSSTF